MNNIRTPRNRLIFAALVIAALAILLALDLANQGLAWRTMYSLTGERQPMGQIRGMVELPGNLLRAPLRLETHAPIQHVEISPYGVNTFLEQEVELEKRERIMQMISDAGFDWIRQQFSWEDIEIHARGDFMDRRNMDVTGEISAWDKYDNIVSLAEQYDLEIMARLDNPPAWSHANPAIGQFAPPDDVQDFVNYAAAVAERYRGRIRYYQVWNEPNIYPEWGEQAVNPEAYTDMLCRTYNALKAVDPNIVVISGALAPTLELTGRDLNDVIFLQRMYDAGAGECFDVLSAQAYGFFSGPTDQRMRPTTVTFSHNLYLRDVMVANGDANTPIWISEAAWNPVDSPDVPADVSAREAYGSVTQAEAAEFMPMGYDRADREWSWVGVMFYWYFKRPADYERNQSWYYFRMVEPDFTPLPIYDAMREYILHNPRTLYRGTHAPDHWAIFRPAGVERIDTPETPYGYSIQIPPRGRVGFWMEGTDVMLRLRSTGGESTVITNDRAQDIRLTVTEQARDYMIPLSEFSMGTSISVQVEGDGAPVLLDSVTVFDQTNNRRAPLIAVGGAMVVLGIGWVINIIVQRRRG